MFKLKTWAATLALALMAGAAPAALVLQANNVEVLDTDTNLLWLYSWRPSVQAIKTWAEGNAWAAGLTTGGAAAGQWRLPVISEFVVAVRSAATGPGPRAVAEPHSAALALLGLGAVALHRRRPGAARVGANKFTPTAGA